MDKGAWQAMVHRVADRRESDTTEAPKHARTHTLRLRRGKWTTGRQDLKQKDTMRLSE